MLRKFGLLSALGVGAYAFFVRPLLLRWGATSEEVNSAFPGADIIPEGKRGATMAVTIDAPPSKVWPWLVQMGYRRAGWYSWDYLDNFGRVSSEHINPEWQTVRLGDILAGPGSTPMESVWEVAAFEPEHFLGLRASFDLRGHRFDPRGKRPRFYSDSLWAFLLERLPDDRTRLIVSGYWTSRPKWLQQVVGYVFLDWAHWIMQMKQFANLKRRTERVLQPA